MKVSLGALPNDEFFLVLKEDGHDTEDHLTISVLKKLKFLSDDGTVLLKKIE